jgi:nucleolar GTP-binding protein
MLSLYFQFDSDDEREAAEGKIARQHKVKSQLDKKSRKNRTRLPRTAGLRTLTELTDELTKAGLDPSRIQERAERIAKLHAAQRKRKREDDEDDGMDVDGEDGEEEGDWEDEGMDVDGEQRPSKKKAKTVFGAVVTKRAPRSDRTFAGLRDEAVSLSSSSSLCA